MGSRRSIGGVAAVLGASLGLVACGSSAPGKGGTAESASSGLAFAKCMRSHGVPNFPDPGGNNGGGLQIQVSQRAGSGGSLTVNGVRVSSPGFQAAMASCHSKLPGGGPPRTLSASQRAAMLKFSQCMRSHGLSNFPDPSFSGGGFRLRFDPSSGIDPSSPAFKAAQAACASLQHGGFHIGPGPGG